MATEDIKFRVLASVAGQGAIESFRRQVSGLSKDSGALRGSIGTLTNGLKALAGAYVVNEAVQFTRSIINVADELDELSEKTGIAVKDLAAFKGLADVEGISLENLGGLLRKLSVNTVEAANGNRQLASAFKAVGVDVRDSSGNIRTAGDVTRDLADRFKNLKDGPEKAALAVRLFGKAGSEIIPFLNKGSEEIDKFSLAISDDFAARAGQFNDSIALIGIQLKNNLSEGVEAALPALQEILNVFIEAPGAGEDTVSTFEAIGEAIRVTAGVVNVFVEAFKQGLDVVIVLARTVAGSVVSTFEQIGDAIVTRARQVKSLTSLSFDEAERLEDAFNKRSVQRGAQAAAEREKLFEGLAQRTEKRVERTFDITNRLSKNSFLLGEGSTGEIRERQRSQTAPAPRAQGSGSIDSSGFGSSSPERDRVKEFIEQQKLETEQRRAALGDINLTTIELLKLTEARKVEAEAVRQGKTLTAEQRTELQEATVEIINQRQELIELERAQSRSFGTGAREFLREYAEEATNTAAQVNQVFTTAFGGLEDALTDFVTTGKLNFKDFANAIIEDLIRISIRRAILGAIAGAFGGGGEAAGGAAFADGGVMTSSGAVPLKKYARGGVANSPQLALFGEGSMPEAYVPLPDGRRIPVALDSQGGGGGSVNVSVNVNVESGNSETRTSGGDTDSGKKLGALVATLVRNEMVNQKRPGGLLA